MEIKVENQAKQDFFVGSTCFENSVMKTEWYDPKTPSSKQAFMHSCHVSHATHTFFDTFDTCAGTLWIGHHKEYMC